jgi:hypothetical protein
MNSLRQHIAIRTLWLLMAIHIFNCSIDAPDYTPAWIPENLAYNDMETITEFLAEEILGLENFFEERDDNDSNDKSVLKVKTILDFFTQPDKAPFYNIPSFIGDVWHKIAPLRLDKFVHQYLDEPNAPPPWYD